MNINYKKVFCVVVFILTTLPSIAFASWWNPFSWFDFLLKKPPAINFSKQVIQDTGSKVDAQPYPSASEPSAMPHIQQQSTSQCSHGEMFNAETGVKCPTTSSTESNIEQQIAGLELKIIQIKQQYQSDVDYLNSHPTEEEIQAQSDYQDAQTDYDNLSQNSYAPKPGIALEFQTGQNAADQRNYGIQLQEISNRENAAVQEMQHALSLKQLRLQGLTSEANQKIEELNLQINGLRLQF